MKLTMTFEAQSDDETDQLMTIDALLKEHPIGRTTTIRDGLNATIVDTTDEPAPMTENDAIGAIFKIIVRVADHDARQRVLAWCAQLASQAGVTVS